MILSFLSVVEDKDDRELLAQIYIKHYGKIQNTIYEITGDQTVSLLLSDYTMIKLANSILELKDLNTKQQSAYVVQTAKETVMDYAWEQKSAEIPVEKAMEEIPNEREKRMALILCQLSQEQLMLLKCKHLNQMSMDEIATVCGCQSLDAARNALQEAERQLQMAME
ncbi:MAG: sigma-70 family RNA polymerase sigma factor [Clostridiales bacterium]|jgi:DNA-directed RNA polymerase specialized sigma24 family protein|nr:sigma-70 family RNA polymerase sigma factor [Clostridiales bacterium]